MTDSRKLVWFVIAPLAVVALIQLVPFGRQHSNPPDGTQVTWDSPETQRLAERACYDCHSNRTRWPWYSSIAPISWRIQNHVNEGREAINFTAFDAADKDVAEAAGEAGEQVTKGEMPPNDYLLMHPEARLTTAEKQTLVAGLDRTFAAFAEHGEGGRGDASERGERSEKGARGERSEKGEAGERDGDRD